MFLTKEEEQVLNGENGPAAQKSMQIVVALGEIYGADKLIPIVSAQVSGVSYKNLGDAGLEYLNELAKDGKVKVKTTLNPAGMDLEEWAGMGIPEDFAEKQLEVIEAFKKFGIDVTCSCTPYLIGNLPKKGEHVAWGESSAVCYINSVVGARTNREGGPSTLAAGIIGKTANYGLHITENRAPKKTVKVNAVLKTAVDFGALGYFIGESIGNEIPMIVGTEAYSLENLKAFGASIATYGGTPLYHMENNTAEFGEFEMPSESIGFGEKELKENCEKLDDGIEPELIVIGCPHCSAEELKRVEAGLKGKKVKKEVWICCARRIKEENAEIVRNIEATGAKVLADTCNVVCPIKKIGFKSIGTNSAKSVYYSRSLNKMKVKFGTLEELMEMA